MKVPEAVGLGCSLLRRRFIEGGGGGVVKRSRMGYWLLASYCWAIGYCCSITQLVTQLVHLIF